MITPFVVFIFSFFFMVWSVLFCSRTRYASISLASYTDMKIQPKTPEFLLDMRYFRNFSLVSLGIRPRSRRCAERTRQGEGRWRRPPKPALERIYLTENSSSANRILRPRRKKLLTESLKSNNHFIYTYIDVCFDVVYMV